MTEQIKNETIVIPPEEVEILSAGEFKEKLTEHFEQVPDVAKPLLKGAKVAFSRIEEALYTAPGFINAVKATIPEETYQAILTNEQKNQIAKGALKLMTKKDGSLMANLVNPETNKIVSTISLKSVEVTPEILQAMTNYAMQMQMAQIAEQIQHVQVAIEEVRQGQEYDRLATAYSCQQKLLQAMEIKNPELRTKALLQIALDAEDSRNLLMQSQSVNVAFLENEPESTIGKIFQGATPDKIKLRINELHESLCAINMVSFVEAMAYQEMGEMGAARKSLEYYAGYVHKTYLSKKGFVERLDMIDPSTERYWSQTLPEIDHKIQALPCNQDEGYLEEGDVDNEDE